MAGISTLSDAGSTRESRGIIMSRSILVRTFRSNGSLWLIATGWLHPSDSSLNIAMGQGHHDAPRPLSLEVPDGHGGWRTAQANLGFPAGRNKTCLIDLTGLLRAGLPHKLRLRTNLEVYWDAIEWAAGVPNAPLKIAAAGSRDGGSALPRIFRDSSSESFFTGDSGL